MKKNNDSQKGGSPLPVALRRSARISSTTYKSAPTLREPRTSTRRWSKNKKPKVKVLIDYSGLRANWTEAHKAQHFFKELSMSLSRKPLRFNCGPGHDERTCIFPSADTVNWTDVSCGYTWIALHGITSYVVVAMDPCLEYKSFSMEYYPEKPAPANFVVLTVLNRMGDLSSTLNIPHHAKGFPFAVVSAAPATFENSQESLQASSRAIEFLKSKLCDCSDFTFGKIFKIAVCALKQMLGPNFKTNQIVQASCKGWGGGTNVLSTTKVDECLNELKAEATSTEAKKGGLQIHPSIEFLLPVSKTAITSLKLRDRTIIAADGRSTDYVTGQIISDSEVKIKCLMNSGIYFAGAGSYLSVYAVYKYLVDKYAEDFVVDINKIAEVIERRIQKQRTITNIEILLVGRGEDGIPEMILIQKFTGLACIVIKDKKLCKIGSAADCLRPFTKLPRRIQNLTFGVGTITTEEEGEAMNCLMESVARACMFDWASGGHIICICIRADGQVRRLIWTMREPASCARGYDSLYDGTKSCIDDNDFDGLPEGALDS